MLTMPDVFGFEAYSPEQIAERVETLGVAKARLDLVPLVLLDMLAGAFIGSGALFSTLVQICVAFDMDQERYINSSENTVVVEV